ncbi:hypothetical protein CsSME_00006474 [Camellia sinensis var. sinensis]
MLRESRWNKKMQWDGNPSIILDVKTRVGIGLPIQVIFNLFLISTELFPSQKYFIHGSFQINFQTTS